MANQCTDNRTNVSTGESATGWVTIDGTTTAGLDTEISYDTYTGSIGEYCTDTIQGTFYNNAATGLFTAGDHAYMLLNCGIVSRLATKANAGLTFRVCGATFTDYAEFELFGSDEWPSAFDGGWVQVVVDIDTLLASPTNTGGTAPTTAASIQYAGFTFIVAGAKPRMADNIWVGGFKILPANTPGIIVEGRNGGATDWDLASVAAVAGIKLSAMLKPGPGGSYVSRAPIQIGINDTSTHAFTEKNKALFFDTQEVMADGFYTLTALGNSGGTTNVTFGIKTGTGDDAVGAQGGSIQAGPTAARWDMDFNDPNVDGVNFYGTQLVHGGDFLLDDPAVSCISTSYIDCSSALVSNSEQLRISVINANTADGVAFMTTDDLTDIVYGSFQFSDGHAVELTTTLVTPQTSKGNLFIGYGATASNDAALYNNAGGAVVVNVTEGGTNATYRNGTSATTTVNVSETVTFKAVDKDNDAIENVRVTAYLQADDSEVINALTNASGIATTTFAGTTPAAIYYKLRKSSTGAQKYVFDSAVGTIETGTGFSVTRTLRVDAVADPAI